MLNSGKLIYNACKQCSSLLEHESQNKRLFTINYLFQGRSSKESASRALDEKQNLRECGSRQVALKRSSVNKEISSFSKILNLVYGNEKLLILKMKI